MVPKPNVCPQEKQLLAARVANEPAAQEKPKMHSQPTILPLDIQGEIYALQDEQGNTIGTGTREVCEVLMYIINKASAGTNSSGVERVHLSRRLNVRAAIAI